MGISRISNHILRIVAIAWVLVLTSCRTDAPTEVEIGAGYGVECASNPCGSEAIALQEAQRWAIRAGKENKDHGGSQAWIRCAMHAYRAIASPDEAVATPAAALVTHCTDGFLQLALARQRGWSEGAMRIGDLQMEVRFRHLSSYLEPSMQLVLARNVPVTAHGGERHARPGFGVSLAVLTPRCTNAPMCQLLPPEGVFRNATAWIEVEPGRSDALPRLVVADPLVIKSLTVGERHLPLAIDTSAAYVAGARTSKLGRPAIWGLLGGDEVGRRAGLYLLEDYDPNNVLW